MLSTKLDELRTRLEEIYDLKGITCLLEWDMEVLMPPKGAEARGRQMSTLAAIAHRRATDPALGTLLDELSDDDSLLPDDKLMVAEAQHDFRRATCLPEAFVREQTEAHSNGYSTWTEARRANDFAAFKPALERNVELARRAADYFGYEQSPYDALLDHYERGMTAARLRALFGPLATSLKDLVARIASSPSKPDVSWLDGTTWNLPAQEKFSHRVLKDMGYDFDAGRLDVAPHPFCTNFDLADVRITSRYFEDMPFSSLQSAMHEGGHALYEQGFDPDYRGTPISDAPSLGIHECNSRMWENMIGRSLPFWRHYIGVFREHFPGQADAITADQAYAAVNQVAPSLIRVEADECTYNLHVIIRFEIECDLIEGRLAVGDLPDAWNAKYKEYLGIDVPNDANGCMQDVHWSAGLLGYFPTYTLGNLYAAQIFEKILADMPDLWANVESGKLLGLREWLREHIHLVGRRKMAPEIVETITGKAPDSAAFLRYLETKFGALYSLNGK